MILDHDPPRNITQQVDDPAQIIVPYIPGMLHRETVDHVVVSGRRAAFIPLDPADPYHYGKILTTWWDLRTDLIVIEQDIVPPFGVCTAFRECDKSFCTYRYPCQDGYRAHGLGCARFSARLQHDHPTLAMQAAGRTAGRGASTHWQALNERFLDLCARAGSPAHIHDGDVEHLHDYAPGDVHAAG